MTSNYELEYEAGDRLRDFNSQRLFDLTLPKVDYVEDGLGQISAFYAVVGNSADARALVFTEIPHTVHLDDDSIKVRLMAQQEVLGADYCVIGIETYNPHDIQLSKSQRQQVKDGNFSPLSRRFAMVVDEVKPRDDQEIYVYGFSRGADVGVQFAHDSLFDEHFAGVEIKRLGAFEPARTSHRFAARTAINFAKSGKKLYDNVLASDSRALLDARNIDPKDPKARKHHDQSVSSGVLSYVMADPKGNLALLRGFSKPTTLTQLIDLSRNTDGPSLLVGRMYNSSVFSEKGYAYLEKSTDPGRLELRQYSGDHSAADKLQKSGALVLQTVGA